MSNLPQLSKTITDKYTLTNNTLIRDVKTNPKDRISVEIGDSKAPDFKPQAKFQRWDNEVNASFRAPEDPLAVVQTEGEKIKYVSPDGYEVHQYDKPDVSEDVGFELELRFADLACLVKRATVVKDNYRIVLTTQFKNVVGYKQPPLTQEYQDGFSEEFQTNITVTETDVFDEQGNSLVHRPENIVNAIVFYHATKGGMNRVDGMEYKVGKAFTDYRIKLIDADGNEQWGDQNWLPESNELELLLDKKWVESTKFPIRIR